MIVKQELINNLKDYFGLNIYESKVWVALLKKGVASAGEVASISGVPRSRTYDVLESLEKRGFAIMRLGKPVKYMGIKPRVILEKLKNNVKKNAEDKIVELSKIKTTNEFEELEALYNVGMSPMKREEVSAALKGKMNISNQIREIIQGAKKEAIICTNVEEILSKPRLFHQTFQKLEKSEVELKIALSGSDELIKKASEKFGIKFKKIDLNAKFFIVDRKEMLFYLSKSADENDTAIWLNSEFFAQAFATLFENAMKSK